MENDEEQIKNLFFISTSSWTKGEDYEQYNKDHQYAKNLWSFLTKAEDDLSLYEPKKEREK